MADTLNPPRWQLRRTDQAAVAVGVATALTATFAWWLLNGGWSNRLVEIDRAEPLEARFEIDINTADGPELMQLPGVGPKLAQRILESRKTVGPFAGVDDLRRVRGIGPKTFERIRPYVASKSRDKPDVSSYKRERPLTNR